jgi:hypothetical protein
LLIEEVIGVLRELEEVGDDWPFELRTRCRQASFASERSALESLFTDLDRLIETRAEFLKAPVDFPEDGLSSSKTLEAVTRAVETGEPFGFVSIGGRDAKEHIASVRIAGRTPSTIDDWMHVQRYVKLHEQVLSFGIRWNELKELLSVPALNRGVASLRHVQVVGTIARQAHRLATHYDVQLLQRARDVFDDAPNAALTGSRADLESIRQQLLRQLTLTELSRAAMQLSDFHEKLAGKSGPVCDKLRTFLDKDLGDSALSREYVAAQYAELMAELRRLAARECPVDRRK